MAFTQDYGWFYTDAEIPEGLVPARITQAQRGLYEAAYEDGETPAKPTGAFMHEAQDRDGYPAVGDFVLLRPNPRGTAGIVSVLPRKSKFSRTDFSGHAAGYVKNIREQVVAANFDYVFILTSLNQDFSAMRVLRYVTQARQGGGEPVVVLSKADLADAWEEQAAEVRALAGDVDVLCVSSRTGQGLDDLERYLQKGTTIVFLGMSGVGKSSLLNALAGEDVMAVKEIREDDARGRHTTTHRELFLLPSGAMVIDTPGMRELGLWDADEAISESFPDIERLISRCRFSNCRHMAEPGCAVQAAIGEGRLSREQWAAYRSQRGEAEFVRRKTLQKGR